MIVVTNAGPLMALGKLGLIHVLHRLYGRVLVPAAVHEEVVLRGLQQGEADAHVVQLAVAGGALEVVPQAGNEVSPSIAELPIGVGEKQTIHLAVVRSAHWTLLDDLLAREAAKQLGLRVKGTLGVIVEARRQNAITPPEVDVIFQSILARGDIWISDSLVNRVWEALRQD
jgi:predicted nucleic acid-binding protein